MVRSMEGKRQQYFEATLQLRNVEKELISFVENEIIRAKIHVAKKDKVKNGYDYQLADNRFTQSLGKKLQQTAGGELAVTSSLFSQKDGKDIYRVTVLFRQAGFKKGDDVIYQGEEFNVKSIGKDILLVGISKPTKMHVKYKDMRRIKKKL
jgi:nonsense-mediated mRNA decay protein 3